MPNACHQLSGLVAVGLVTTLLGVISTEYVWDHQSGGDPLPDVTFQLFDRLGWDWSANEFPIPNVIAGIMYGIAILSVRPKYRLKIAMQFIFIECVLTSIRAITVMVTLFPNIHLYPYCEERPGTLLETAIKMVQHGTCADYMFSGHTSTAFLCYMFVHKESERREQEKQRQIAPDDETIYCACCQGCMKCFNRVERAITSCYAIGNRCGCNWIETISLTLHFCLMFALLLQRWHYTVDIIVAVVITWLAFKVYKDQEDIHVDAVHNAMQASAQNKDKWKDIARKTNHWYFFTRFEIDIVKNWHWRRPRFENTAETNLAYEDWRAKHTTRYKKPTLTF